MFPQIPFFNCNNSQTLIKILKQLNFILSFFQNDAATDKRTLNNMISRIMKRDYSSMVARVMKRGGQKEQDSYDVST